MSEVVYYRADVAGLKPGELTSNTVDPDNVRVSTYATTGLELARAFAVTGFGVSGQRDQERSVYRVTLDDPIRTDPDFRSDDNARVVTSELGTIVNLVEANVSMGIQETTALMARYAQWPDGSPIYKDEGYASVPPKYLLDNRYDDHNYENMLQELETLDTYPDPQTIQKFLAERYD